MDFQLPTFSKLSEVSDFLQGKPFGTACLLTGGPTATDNVRVSLKRYGFGCSVVRMENGWRRIELKRLTPHVEKSHADWTRLNARSNDPSRRLVDYDSTTLGTNADGMVVGDVIRISGNKKTIERDIGKRGWKVSIIKTGAFWEITRRA